MRAKGGFGLVCTCASHVDPLGKGFPGQLGIFNDEQIEGHQRLSAGIQAEGSIAMIQLHHAGMRSPEKLIGEKPLCPSDNEETGARALRLKYIPLGIDLLKRPFVRKKADMTELRFMGHTDIFSVNF
jgi:2,4-dienoyl-CoA reductase-like NADH-dependent reductase (Old Yellow Enzyme family)